jgi:hypothetical protein
MPKNHSARELRDWVAAAQGGDKEAFSEVVKRCQDMAYCIAYAMLGDTGLAQDAAQEAFIAATQRRSRNETLPKEFFRIPPSKQPIENCSSQSSFFHLKIVRTSVEATHRGIFL